MRRYQTPHALAPEAGAVINDTLETIAREGARAMLDRALRAEVDEHLGRARYERGPAFSGYRNGYARPREIGIGTWSVPVRAPRVRDTPPDAPPFASAILPRRRYLSASTQRLFARLYLEGLSGGDFEPAHHARYSATFSSKFWRVYKSGVFALRGEVAAESWSVGAGKGVGGRGAGSRRRNRLPGKSVRPPA
mgnify:CR=1 FL=1